MFMKKYIMTKADAVTSANEKFATLFEYRKSDNVEKNPEKMLWMSQYFTKLQHFVLKFSTFCG